MNPRVAQELIRVEKRYPFEELRQNLNIETHSG